MFWRFGLHRSSKIDEILARDTFTLEELLDENDILQECKAEKKELLDYLARDDVMEKLLDYVCTEPAPDMDEKVRFKYPSLASEVLSCASWQIIDALNKPANLARLWGMLNTKAPLHPLLGSFFLKCFTVLAMKKPDETQAYLRASPHIIDRIFEHLETPAIADVLLRICATDSSNGVNVNFQIWLCDEMHVIDRMIEAFASGANATPGLLANLSLLIQDIVFSYRKEMSDREALSSLRTFYARLMTEELVEKLLTFVLAPDAKSTERGLQLVHDLIILPPKGEEEQPYHDFELERHETDIVPILRVVAHHVEALHRVLSTPPSSVPIVTATGDIGVPLGSVRVKALRLLQVLMGTNNEDVFREFERLGTLTVCLDLFFQYPDNNFLHKHVADIINSILTPENHPLFQHLFVGCQLVSRIMTGWAKCAEAETARRGHRLGYMGHLGNIAAKVSELKSETQPLASLLEEPLYLEWEAFVAQQLVPYRRKLTEEIGGPKPVPVLHSPSDDDDDMHNPADQAVASAAYAHYYQQHSYSGNLPEDFGYIDDAEPVDAVNQFGIEGDFGHNDEFQVESHDWTSNATDPAQWQINDGVNGSADPAMPDDEWTERQIEDQSAPVAAPDGSDSDSSSGGLPDSDDDHLAPPSQAMDVPLSPLGAKAVAAMPTRDPFASPARTKLVFGDGDHSSDEEQAAPEADQGGWAHFDEEPQAMDVRAAVSENESSQLASSPPQPIDDSPAAAAVQTDAPEISEA